MQESMCTCSCRDCVSGVSAVAVRAPLLLGKSRCSCAVGASLLLKRSDWVQAGVLLSLCDLSQGREAMAQEAPPLCSKPCSNWKKKSMGAQLKKAHEV